MNLEEFLYHQILKLEDKTNIFFFKNNEIEIPIHLSIAIKSNYIKKAINNLDNSRQVFLDYSEEILTELRYFFYFSKLDESKFIFELYEIANFLVFDDLINFLNEKIISEEFLKLENFSKIYHIVNHYNPKNKTLQQFIKNNLTNYLISSSSEEDLIIELIDQYTIIIPLFYTILLKKEFSKHNLDFILNLINTKYNWKYLTQSQFWTLVIPNLEKYKINVSENWDKISFISKFNGQIKNEEDENKYSMIFYLQEDDILDIKINNQWYLGKIIKKIESNIEVIFNIQIRGFDEKLNQTILLPKDFSLVDLPYKNSVNFRTLEKNQLVEYKINDKWKIFKVIEINQDFIGLVDNDNGFIKVLFDDFNLTKIHTHTTSYYFGRNINTTYQVNWNLIDYGVYLKDI